MDWRLARKSLTVLKWREERAFTCEFSLIDLIPEGAFVYV